MPGKNEDIILDCLERMQAYIVNQTCFSRGIRYVKKKRHYYLNPPSPWEKIIRGYFSPVLNSAFHFAGDITEPRQKKTNRYFFLIFSTRLKLNLFLKLHWILKLDFKE